MTQNSNSNGVAAVQSSVRAFGVAVAAACLGLTACADTPDDPADPTPEETSAPAPAPEDIADPEEAAIAAYLRYWTTVMDSFAAPDGVFSEFETISADQALEQARATEQGWIDEGVHGTGAFAHDIAVKDALVDEATGAVQQVVVIDCLDSTGTQVLDAAGEPVVDEEYGHREVQSRIELIDGFWIVTAMAVQEIGTCEPEDDS